MAETLALTDVTPFRSWWPSAFDTFLGTTGYADFRFTMPDSTKRTVIRMLSNKDVRFYGDLHLTDLHANRARFTAGSLEWYGQGTIAAKEVILKVGLEPEDGISTLWGIFKLYQPVDPMLDPVRVLQSTGDVRFEAHDGDDWKDWTFEVCSFYVKLNCPTGTFEVIADSGLTRLKVDANGFMMLAAPDGASATIALDSTAGGGKTWTMVSEESDGTLRFVNTTDEGTPKVELTPGGSVYAAEFVGTQVVSAAPSDSVGRVGAIVVDTANNRIWVKVAGSGTNRWRYATLTAV